MTWSAVPFAGGVVRTRAERALDPGEWRRLSNVRLEQSDVVQVHNDVGQVLVSENSDTYIAGPFYLSFEGTADKLLTVTTDGVDTFLNTATVSGSALSFSTLYTISGAVATKAWVVHRGNQYFVGTDQGNFVIEDNVDRPMGMDIAAATTATYTAAADGAYVANDVVVYVVTEYDSTNDVESASRYLGTGNTSLDDFAFPSGGANDNDYPTITWTPANKANVNADKVRIYKQYLGNFSDNEGVVRAFEMEDGNEVFLGRLVAEVNMAAGTWQDDEDSKYAFGPPYPVIATDPVAGQALYYQYKKPRNFTMGCLFGDSLVVNDPATSKQILRYSPPGYPEYQPDPYFMYFATERSDEIVGLRVINDVMVVLTTGSVHRVNYLPVAGDLSAQQGRVQEPISKSSGCVSRLSHEVVETPQGEFVVWLSERGLEWTNGAGWSDACPDFDASEITTSTPLLVNNRKLYRLELWDGEKRWDFYYHPSHLKGGRLKLTGPHDTRMGLDYVSSPVTKGGCSNEDYVWVAGSNIIIAENDGNTPYNSVVETGHIKAGPFNDLELQGVALTHSGTSGTTYGLTVTGKHLGAVEQAMTGLTMPNPELDETGKVDVGMSGKWVKFQWDIEGQTAWSAGPCWLDVYVTGGGQ